MIQVCEYNPVVDVQEVVPDMSIDINESIKTGVVLDLGTSLDSNGIEDVEAITGRVGDIFDALEYEKSLNSRPASPGAPVSDGAPTAPAATE